MTAILERNIPLAELSPVAVYAFSIANGSRLRNAKRYRNAPLIRTFLPIDGVVTQLIFLNNIFF